LVERLLCKQEVRSSRLLVSTNRHHRHITDHCPSSEGQRPAISWAAKAAAPQGAPLTAEYMTENIEK